MKATKHSSDEDTTAAKSNEPPQPTDAIDKLWNALKLTRRDGDSLIYEMAVTDKPFSELYLRFEGKAFEPCYQQLTIFAESKDKSLCYNEDPRFPPHYVQVHITMHPHYRLDRSPREEELRRQFLSLPEKPVNGTPAIYHVPFDLRNKGSYQVSLGGTAAAKIIKQYVIVIDLQPETNSYNYVLFYK